MACPAIITGDRFLIRVLSHIDCQAQVIGSYGYQALGEPGSAAALLVSGLLALFIALFGIRLLFGPPPGARDLVYDVIKIGMVVTLAFSWPAFRTLIYDVTLKGPAQIAHVIEDSSQPRAAGTMVDRLQRVDNAIVTLIEVGTGRNAGAFLSEGPGATFAGTALQDDAALGYSRLLFLAGVIAPLAMLRIGAGVLLALAPIVAGLFFFTQTRGIFAGWLKGLVFTIGGSVAITVGLAVQLAIVEPWLADALLVRDRGYATPSAPLELFALMFAFMLVHFALLWLLARVVFHRGWPVVPEFPAAIRNPAELASLAGWGRAHNEAAPAAPAANARAKRISSTIENSIRREQSSLSERLVRERTAAPAAPASAAGTIPFGPQPARLGSSFRRPGTRPLRSATQRDQTK